MTKEEIILLKKLTALNKIRKIYGSSYKLGKNEFGDNHSEQRDDIVKVVILNLEKELKELK